MISLFRKLGKYTKLISIQKNYINNILSHFKTVWDSLSKIQSDSKSLKVMQYHLKCHKNTTETFALQYMIALL